MTLTIFKKTHRQSGQTLLVSLIFLMAISLTIVMGIANPIVRHRMNAASFTNGRSSNLLAEAALEDVLYRLKNNIPINSSEVVNFNGRSVDVSIATDSNGKTISVETDTKKGMRKLETSVVTDQGVSFLFALQSGNGGFDISGGSVVNGNVFSNGDIVGAGGSTINGNATAANSSALETTLQNNSPLPPSSYIKFGDTNTTQDIAQSFEVSNTVILNKINFYMRRTSSAPADITARIKSDSAGKPSGTTLTSVTIPSSAVATTDGWVTAVFPGYLRLDPGEVYWIVLDASTNSTKNYSIAANSSLASFKAMRGTSGGVWNNTSPVGMDVYFELFTGGFSSSISGIRVNEDAWANSVINSTIIGSLFCKTGSGNGSKVCNTTRPDPSPAGFAISDANISSWKSSISDAMTGGTTYEGNLSIGWQGTTTTSLRKINGNLSLGGGSTSTFGPLEIMGDVNISGGAKLVGGPFYIHGDLNNAYNGIRLMDGIWIEGDMNINSGAPISFDPSVGKRSLPIIVDGIVNMSGGSNFSGSGQQGSYPIVISTSNCVGANCGGNNAITVGGGSGAVILYAPYGTIYFAGGTSAKAMSAYKIVISGGGNITYDSGLVDLSVSSSPSGTWNVSSWKEVE